MAVVAWIMFYPSDVNGDVLQQHDVMQGVANGQEGVLHEQQTGEITRWTDALFGGMPTFQIRPTYANSGWLSWVGKVYSLGFPEPVSWIFMMMLGFFILMLAFKVKWYLAVLGAIGYGLSSYFFILIGAGHIWKLLTLTYVPPTLAGIVWCYRGKYLAGAGLAALAGAMQLLSNHVQMTYYFGFVIVALVIGFLIQAISEHKLKQWGIATALLVVAGGLAIAANAPNLYMSYKYQKESIRGGHSELTPVEGEQGAQLTDGGLDKEYITMWSYGKDETFTLMIPNVKGGATIKPEHGDNKFLNLAETSQAQSLNEKGKIGGQEMQAIAQFAQYFGDQPMTNGPVYVGVLIFALALLGVAVVRGPVKWSLVVVTIISIFLAWGHNMMWLTDLMIDYFPFYNKFRAPASWLVVAELTMPLLAVLALKEMFDSKQDFWREHKWAIIGAFGFTALVCLLTWLIPSMFGSYSQQEVDAYMAQLQQYPTIDQAIRDVRGAMVSSDAMRSLLFLALGCAVLVAYRMNKINPMVTSLALAAVVLIDMGTVNKRFVDSETFVPAEEVQVARGYAPRPVDTKILQDKQLSYRVLDLQHFGDAMPSYFHKTVGGYHAAKLTRYNDLINRQLAQNNQRVVDMLNTKYIITDDNNYQLNPGALGNAWFVDSIAWVKGADQEMAALDSLPVAHAAVADEQFREVLKDAQPVQPGDTIALTSYAANKLTFKSHSANGGLAVFSEVYFPWGWQATIDGKTAPIGRVNYVLRAMQLPAGDHTIVMTYDPQEVHQTEGLATGAIIAIFAILLLGAGLAFRRHGSLTHGEG
ncbi:MAG: YfhO family protein [Muribaculaceae bacterium]|nr:YfhO family protein [Muribaculaceae bacterium]